MAGIGGFKTDIASVQVGWPMADFAGMNRFGTWVDRAIASARATGGVPLARTGMRVEMIVVHGDRETMSKRFVCIMLPFRRADQLG
ncbi:hypothetical protein DPM13_15365 [Paracoccus mutanolyticus]|uniref:Uncharacterized protein n=1 Tax=Paracoccus mutanolyticus TaxID=1499308 RepID=A0ABM6WT78_9RHOB|nr:hypothetical protein [Paracoccus mutanolyticus]AWX93908.1 hypothetical protein DPM13_15365 [Paracoccus mutanolyticus]